MTDNTPDAPAVVESVARLLELMLVRRGVLEDRLEGTLDDAENLLKVLAMLRSCRPIAALPSEDVERVARAIAKDIDRQDCDSWTPDDDWDFTMPYLDQGEVNFLEVARAAIAAMTSEQIAEPTNT